MRGEQQRDADCNVPGLAEGDYDIAWYATSTGKVVRHETGKANHPDHFGYGLESKPPAFRGGIAARVIRLGKACSGKGTVAAARPGVAERRALQADTANLRLRLHRGGEENRG